MKNKEVTYGNEVSQLRNEVKDLQERLKEAITKYSELEKVMFENNQYKQGRRDGYRFCKEAEELEK